MIWAVGALAYLLAGGGFVAWFVVQDPANRPVDHWDYGVLVSYVLLWPLIVLWLLLNLVSDNLLGK